MRPGATTFTRIRRRCPSNAACRMSPASAAFDASYDGMRLPGRVPAADATSTIELSSGMVAIANLQATTVTDVLVNDCGSAAAFTEKARQALETILKEERA